MFAVSKESFQDIRTLWISFLFHNSVRYFLGDFKEDTFSIELNIFQFFVDDLRLKMSVSGIYSVLGVCDFRFPYFWCESWQLAFLKGGTLNTYFSVSSLVWSRPENFVWVFSCKFLDPLTIQHICLSEMHLKARSKCHHFQTSVGNDSVSVNASRGKP